MMAACNALGMATEQGFPSSAWRLRQALLVGVSVMVSCAMWLNIIQYYTRHKKNVVEIGNFIIPALCPIHLTQTQ
jgi:hypothetical protein